MDGKGREQRILFLGFVGFVAGWTGLEWGFFEREQSCQRRASCRFCVVWKRRVSE